MLKLGIFRGLNGSCKLQKRSEFKLFGVKIFEHFDDYYEHSNDKDDDDDDEQIKLTKRIIERNT